jgi:hypothetical protein
MSKPPFRMLLVATRRQENIRENILKRFMHICLFNICDSFIIKVVSTGGGCLNFHLIKFEHQCLSP